MGDGFYSNVTVIGDSKGLEFGVLSGGYLAYLRYKGRDLMYPLDTIDYGQGIRKERGGTFPCCPWFGPPPAEFKDVLPQHGWLREREYQVYSIKNGARIHFVVGGVKGYPWVIVGEVEYLLEQENILQIRIVAQRDEKDGTSAWAPVNFAMHHYWERGDHGIQTLLHSQRKLQKECSNLGTAGRKLYPQARIIACPKFASLNFLDIFQGPKVTMWMEGAPDPQIVLWSDYPDFLCVEQLASPQNISLALGEKIEISFFLEFH